MKAEEGIKVCDQTKPEEIAQLQQLAKESGLFAGESITEITYMPGGLTNRNFKVVIGGKKYAFRLAGPGTADYLNRPAEKEAVAAVNVLGISPEFYYYDVSTGSNVARFVEGATMVRNDFQTRSEVLEKAAEIVRKYHNSGIIFEGRFDPFTEINSYRQFLKDNNWTKFYDEMPLLSEIYDKIDAALQKNPPKLVCSHNDCLSENFLFNGEKMELIDWEYCGMNIYNFDLAAVISENELSEEKEEEFMQYYFQGEPSERQRADVLIGKFIMDGLWVPWAFVQAATKPDEVDFYWDWGYVRVQRCLRTYNNPNFERYLEIVGTPE